MQCKQSHGTTPHQLAAKAEVKSLQDKDKHDTGRVVLTA